MDPKKNLVILPGWGGDKKSWSAFAKKAGEYFDVKIIELPCFGDEPCPKEVWGVEEYADFVKKKITKDNLQNPVILGHSFGGQVAVHLAANNPEICDKLILSGAAVFRKKISLKRIIFKPIATIGSLIFKLPVLNKKGDLAKKILYKIARSADYGETSGIKREIFKKIIKQDVSRLLESIKIPTLIVWGAKDRHVPLRKGRKMAKLMPNSEFKIIKGYGHGLQIRQSENLLDIIKSFASK